MIDLRRWRRTGPLAALFACLIAVSFGTVLAQPASATPVCTGTKTVTRGSSTWSLAANGSTLDCHLQRTNVSNAVRSLQNHLNLCYSGSSGAIGHVAIISTLTVDGNFGGLTEAALKKVQSYHRIGADGVYGPQTRRTINFFGDDGVRARCLRYGA